MRIQVFLTANALEINNASLWQILESASKSVSLNALGCLKYFGGMNSTRSLLYRGQTNRKCNSVSRVLGQNGQFKLV